MVGVSSVSVKFCSAAQSSILTFICPLTYPGVIFLVFERNQVFQSSLQTDPKQANIGHIDH